MADGFRFGPGDAVEFGSGADVLWKQRIWSRRANGALIYGKTRRRAIIEANWAVENLDLSRREQGRRGKLRALGVSQKALREQGAVY